MSAAFEDGRFDPILWWVIVLDGRELVVRDGKWSWDESQKGIRFARRKDAEAVLPLVRVQAGREPVAVLIKSWEQEPGAPSAQHRG